MTRSIEQLVAIYQAASDVESRRKKTWPYVVDVSALLRERLGTELTAQDAVDLSARIATMLRATLPAGWADATKGDDWDREYEELLDVLENLAPEDVDHPKYENPEDFLDEHILTPLYDWAFDKHVWLGYPTSSN